MTVVDGSIFKKILRPQRETKTLNILFSIGCYNDGMMKL